MNNLIASYDAMVHHPLAGVALTLLAFKIALYLNRRTGWLIFQPVFMSTVLIVAGLTLFNIGYEEYRISTSIIVLMLGPATVALALPLYNSLALIKKMWLPITLTLVIGGTFTVLLVVALGKLAGIEQTMLMTLVPKSVTTPVAILITEKIGGVVGVVPVFVLLSGIMGAMIGPFLLRVAGVTHPAATGMAIGLTSHAIGTSRLFEINQQAAAFGALAMSLMAVVSAIVLPLFVGI
jgi:predicted murein hydrolase (TIGR00659 family)